MCCKSQIYKYIYRCILIIVENKFIIIPVNSFSNLPHYLLQIYNIAI